MPGAAERPHEQRPYETERGPQRADEGALGELRRTLLGEFDETDEGAVAAAQQPARGHGGEQVAEEHGQAGQQLTGGQGRRGGRVSEVGVGAGLRGGRVESGVADDPGGVGGAEGRGPRAADEPGSQPHEGVVGLRAQAELTLAEAEEDVQAELSMRRGRRRRSRGSVPVRRRGR